MTTVSTEHTTRRPSLMGPNESEVTAGLPPSPPSSRSFVVSGTDVTPTSPSASGLLVSIRPLPFPSPYQPSSSALRKEESRTPTPMPSAVSLRSSAPVMPSCLSPCATPTPASMVGTSTSMATSSSTAAIGKHKENTGRWLAEEHEVFLKGLNEHGKQWKKIAVMIKTRSVVQVRTHAQKYFQKLLKSEKKDDGKDQSLSISTSTATSYSTTRTASPSTAIKRKSSTKGDKTASPTTPAKKRRVSLEPKPQKLNSVPSHYHASYAPDVHAAAPTSIDHTAIDPSFMNTLGDGEFDESILELLDDSSVEAVEQVIGSDYDDMDMEPNPVLEPNSVSPSVSSVSLEETKATSKAFVQTEDSSNNSEMFTNRQHVVTSPTCSPEDFTIHDTIGTSSILGAELSPTSVACMMDIKDFEQKTSNFVEALDWLMDVGVYQLPAPAEDQEGEWGSGHATVVSTSSSAPITKEPLSASKLVQVNSSALSVLDRDVF